MAGSSLSWSCRLDRASLRTSSVGGVLVKPFTSGGGLSGEIVSLGLSRACARGADGEHSAPNPDDVLDRVKFARGNQEPILVGLVTWAMGNNHGPRPRDRPPVRSTAVTRSSAPRRGVPSPLSVAASIAGIEAAILVIQGLTLLPALHGERLAMGAT